MDPKGDQTCMATTGSARVFVDPAPLERTYAPDTVVGRTRERAALERSTMDALRSSAPEHVGVYGGSGTGKTLLVDVVTDAVLEELEAAAGVVRVSCAAQERTYRVAISLVNALRGDDPLASTGYPLETVLESLRDRLTARDDPLLVVLDDVQVLDLGSDALASLFGVLLTNPDVAVVVVADDPRFRNELEWSLRQRFAGREVHFPAYDRETLLEILEARAAVAFRSGAVDEAVLERCASLGVDAGGSAWRAIRLLREAGRAAERDASDRVELAHVEVGRDGLAAVRLRETLPDTPHAGLAVLALAEATAEPGVEPRMRRCYERYRELCGETDLDPVGERAVQGYLRDLSEADFLSTERHHCDSPGQYYVYELATDPAAVYRVLRDADVPGAALQASRLSE